VFHTGQPENGMEGATPNPIWGSLLHCLGLGQLEFIQMFLMTRNNTIK
jgi:hypothetical protein